jgi:5'-3' exonuclease
MAYCSCESWTWYYPYLYAPLASDLVDLAQYDITFERGAPFTPLMQLLSVLPPQSSTMLPEPYKNLMIDPASPLVEFYPKDFEVDANGKKNSWECIVRIPFINEEKLVGAVCEIDHRSKLQEHERRRNIAGEEYTAQPTKPGLVDTRQRAGVDLVDKGGWGNALTDDRRGHHHTTPRKFSDQDRRPPFKRNSAGDKRR